MFLDAQNVAKNHVNYRGKRTLTKQQLNTNLTTREHVLKIMFVDSMRTK